MPTYLRNNAGLDLNEDTAKAARTFIASLCVVEEFEAINALREHAFASSKRDLRKVSPTWDAFHQQLIRTLQPPVFMAPMWANCLSPLPPSMAEVLLTAY